MPDVILSKGFHGLNRVVTADDLDASESPDTTDARNAGRLAGSLGPRLGRYRQSVESSQSVLGLGLLAAAHGRYRVVADNGGAWTAAAVAWGGVTPATPTSAAVSSMDTSAIARFVQFKERLYGTNGRERPQALDGNRWRNMGILSGVDLSTGQFAPTISLAGGLVLYPTVGVIAASVATLTVGAHTIVVGQAISVLLSDTDFNGSFTVTAVTSTTISYGVTTVTKASNTVVGTVATGSASAITVKFTQITANVMTITTTAATSLVTGNTVYFSSPTGNSGNAFIAANFFPPTPVSITVLTSTTFTYAVTQPNLVQSGPWNGSTNAEGHIMPIINVNIGTGAATSITGSYYYMVVPTCSSRFDANGRGIEGIPSNVSAVASPVSQSVVISGIPTHADPQVDYWNIYRTTNGGFDSGTTPTQQDFFYLGRVTNGTATYTDTMADSTGWYISGTNINRLRFNQNIPPTVKHMVEYGDRLFGWGFDPITCTVSATSASASLTAASVDLGTGVKGCYIRFAGEDVRYQILARTSSTALTLDRAYVGSTATKTATIFRNPWELYFSEFRDADAWGPDGEQRRNILEVPGRHAITACVPFEGSLLVFTATEIYVVNGKGPNRFDVRMMPDPAYSGLGCVSGDAAFRCDNEVHFLSLDGPAMVTSSGNYFEPQLYGSPLNLDWLDGLTAAELALSCGGTDGRAVWFSVPVSGQTLNSKTYRYERDTKSWWEETEMHPLRFVRQDGTDGQLDVLFYLQGKSVIRPAYGTVDLVDYITGTLAGAITTTSVATATIPTSNGGCVEAYIRFYRAGVFVGARRIISNTSSSVTWSSSATLPGAGTLVVVTGDTYEIGNIGWKWLSKNLEVPGHLTRNMEVFASFTKSASATILQTNLVDGVESSNIQTIVCANKTASMWEANRAARTYAVRLASRNGAILNSLAVHQEVEAGSV